LPSDCVRVLETQYTACFVRHATIRSRLPS
jgi:hypothetical protein